MEFKEFLEGLKLELIIVNNYEYFRIVNQTYHDFSNFDDICKGCRACILSTCEIVHYFLEYLLDKNWTEEQISKYFNLEYVNIKRHKSEYPGGCHVKRENDEVACDFHKMFIIDKESTLDMIKTNYLKIEK